MDIGCYSADEKTKQGNKTNGQYVEYTCWHSDSIFFLMFLHSGFEFGVLNIEFVAELTD